MIYVARRLLSGHMRAGLRTHAVRVVLIALSAASLLTLLHVPRLQGIQDQIEANRSPAQVSDSAAPIMLGWGNLDFYEGEPIWIKGFASSGGLTVAPPGLERLPQPGEVWVSEGLARILDRHRANDVDPELLLNRFPGPVTGTIGRAGSTDPSDLVVYYGQDKAILEARPHYVFNSFGSPQVSSPSVGQAPGPRYLAKIVATLSILLPASALLVLSGRLGAARSTQRGKQLNEIGAPARVGHALIASEVAIFSLLGVAAGTILFAAIGQMLEGSGLVPVSYWAHDLRPTAFTLTLVLGAAVAGSAAGIVVPDFARAEQSQLNARNSLPLTVALATFGLLWFKPSLLDSGVRFASFMVATSAFLFWIARFVPTMVAGMIKGLDNSITGFLTNAHLRTMGRPLRLVSAGLATGMFVSIVALGLLTSVVSPRTDERLSLAFEIPTEVAQVRIDPADNDAGDLQALGALDLLQVEYVQGEIPGNVGLLTIIGLDCGELASHRLLKAEFASQCAANRAVVVGPAKATASTQSFLNDLAMGRAELSVQVRADSAADQTFETSVITLAPIDTEDLQQNLALTALASEYGLAVVIPATSLPPRASAVRATDYFFRASDSSTVERARTFFAKQDRRVQVEWITDIEIRSVSTTQRLLNGTRWAVRAGFLIALIPFTLLAWWFVRLRSKEGLRKAERSGFSAEYTTSLIVALAGSTLVYLICATAVGVAATELVARAVEEPIAINWIETASLWLLALVPIGIVTLAANRSKKRVLTLE